jgi:hypothetical protein
MAGYRSDSDNDDELLNLNLFARKSFGFQGFSKEKENTLKSIVKVRLVKRIPFIPCIVITLPYQLFATFSLFIFLFFSRSFTAPLPLPSRSPPARLPLLYPKLQLQQLDFPPCNFMRLCYLLHLFIVAQRLPLHVFYLFLAIRSNLRQLSKIRVHQR